MGEEVVVHRSGSERDAKEFRLFLNIFLICISLDISFSFA